MTLTNVVFEAVCMVLDVTCTIAAEIDTEQTRMQTRTILTTSVTDRCFSLTPKHTTHFMNTFIPHKRQAVNTI